jgi:hypothetical protein
MTPFSGVRIGDADLEDEPWTDPDHPDPVLDAAYRGGIVAKPERRTGAFGAVWDTITVLRARGRRLAKLVGRDGRIVSYDEAKHFDLSEIPVDGLDHFEQDLRRLLHQPNRCIVRGGIADPGRVTSVRRLLHPDDAELPTLVEVPRCWLPLDFDKLTRPADVAVEDLAACATIAIAALPSEFHAARCLVQATASHGFKPGLRLRLWFWLDRPVGTAELKRWLSAVPVDHAVFNPAQIIYTAAPVFDWTHDPLPTRLMRLRGAACVTVPALPKPERTSPAKPVKPSRGLSPYGDAALDGACRRIINAPAGEQEATLNGEGFSIGRLVGAGAMPERLARKALVWAGHQMSDHDPRRPWRSAEIEAKVNRAVTAGMRQPRENRPHG